MQPGRCAKPRATFTGLVGSILLVPALLLTAGTVVAEKETIDVFGPFAIPETSGGGDPATIDIPVADIAGTITGVSVSIAGSGNCSDAGVNAAFGVTHAWVGDLRFVLESPAGTQVVLFDQPNNGGSGANICQIVLDDSAVIPFDQSLSETAPFSGQYKPDQPLSALNGQAPNGTWKLIVSDVTTGDTGTLNQFALHIDTDAGTPAPPPIVGIDVPADDTETINASIPFSGYASNEFGDVATVRYAVVQAQTKEDALAAAKGGSGTTGTATDPSGDGSWSTWSFTAPLENGVNFVFTTAESSSGAASASAVREVLSNAGLNLPPTLSVTSPADPDGDRIIARSSGVTSVLFTGLANDPDGSVAAVQFTTGTGPNPVFSPVQNLEGSDWQHTFNVAPGQNPIAFRSVDNEGRSSAVAQWNVIVSDTNIPPFITVDPIPAQPFGTQVVSVTGSAGDPDGFISLVEYRVQMETVVDPPETKYNAPLGVPKGPVVDDNPWLPANAVTPNFERWQFQATDLESDPASPTTNFYEVRSVDNEGAVSGIEGVTITVLQQTVAPPVVAIQDPGTDLVVEFNVGSIAVLGIATPGDNAISVVQWRTIGANGTSSFQNATDLSGNGTFSSWSFQAPLAFGLNTIEVRALDTGTPVTISASTDDTTLQVTRTVPDNLPPVVTIDFPATSQTVPQSTTTMPFSGSSSDPDDGPGAPSTVAGVTYRIGGDVFDLGPPQFASNDSGDWSSWSFDAPLLPFENYIEVSAFDEFGAFSQPVVRIIERESDNANLAIVSPRQGFVALNRENSVDVRGRATIGPEGLLLVQYSVTTETAFDPSRKNEFLPATIAKEETTPPQLANDDSGDFTRWSFTAPLGVGMNTIMIESLDAQGQRIALIDRDVVRLGPGVLSDLMVLTDDPTDAFGGDVWGSENVDGLFQTPFRFGPTGFHHDPDSGWLSVGGDFSGDGLMDFGAVTPFGVFFTVRNNGTRTVGPSTMRGAGYTSNPDLGHTVLVGDFDGDGFDDLAQINPAGQIRVGWNDGAGGIPAPVLAASPALTFDPDNGYWLQVGDFNGDGSDDIAQISPSPSNAEVVLSNGSRGFFAKENWGFISFVWDPNNQAAVHAGDFNGDGIDDLATIDIATRAVVATSTGSSFAPPQVWGGLLGYHDDQNRGRGWWVFGMDATGDGVDDLVQINEFGEAWVGESTGRGSFEQPILNAPLGFNHKPNGPWQTIPGPAVP